MKNLIWLLSMFIALQLNSQTYYHGELFDGYFYEKDTFRCLDNPSKLIYKHSNWNVFQTANDFPDGERLANCVNTIDTMDQWGRNLMIYFDQYIPDKPIFIEAIKNSNYSARLYPNYLYSFELNADTAGIDLSFETNCEQGICTGAFITTSLPENEYNLKNRIYDINSYRWHNGYPSHNNAQLNFCLPTEKFDDENHKLESLILKLTPKNWSSAKPLRFNYFVDRPYLDWLERGIGFYDQEVYVHEKINDTTYQYTIYGDGYDNHVVKHWDTGFPSPENISYSEFYPYEGSDSQKIIQLYLMENAGLFFQPFTALRGKLVDGEDSVRHKLEIIQDGATVCLNAYIEVSIAIDVDFVYKSGTIDLSGHNSCFRIKTNGDLIIDEDATLEYGINNKGMIYLEQDGEIQLRKNASLIINNTMVLHQSANQASSKYKHRIILGRNAHLDFGKNFEIINAWNSTSDSKLYVIMKGGTVDLSKMNTTQRNKVVLIYDTISQKFRDNITLLSNPCQNQLSFTFNSENEQSLEANIFDLSGRIITTANRTVQKGLNYIDISIDALSRGNYLLLIRDSQNESAIPFVSL